MQCRLHDCGRQCHRLDVQCLKYVHRIVDAALASAFELCDRIDRHHGFTSQLLHTEALFIAFRSDDVPQLLRRGDGHGPGKNVFNLRVGVVHWIGKSVVFRVVDARHRRPFPVPLIRLYVVFAFSSFHHTEGCGHAGARRAFWWYARSAGVWKGLNCTGGGILRREQVM